MITTLIFYFAGLGDDETHSACSLAVKNICQNCGSFLAESLPELMELYKQVQAYGDVTTPTALQDAILEEEDVENIVEGISFVVSSLPIEMKRNAIQQMVDNIMDPIQRILTALRTKDSKMDAQQVAIVIPLFERLTTIIRSIDDPEDIGEILYRLWPWVDEALSYYHSDGVASERICRFPRYAIRHAKEKSWKSLPSISQVLVNRFEQTGHPCFLYVASEFIKTFGHDSGQGQHLQLMLVRLLTSACRSLSSLQAVTSNPDLADDVFLMAGRGVNYAPHLMMSPELLAVLIATASNGILVQHKEACSSMCAFLVRLLDPGTHRKLSTEQLSILQGALQPHAPRLTKLSIAGVAGALPTSRIHEMCDVLYALLKSTRDSIHWVYDTCAALPEVVPKQDCQRFMNMCQAVIQNDIGEDDERHLLDALVELSEVCRRHYRVEQAVMSALLNA